jgi:hypothetical protein
MNPKLRAILIGIISLAAVLAIYLLYSLASKNPQIDIDMGAKSFEAFADVNTDEFDREIGKIAGVGIGDLRKTVFRHMSNGRVDREFGIEELLREENSEWEVAKPFLNIYQNDFKCFITADKGKVHVENAATRPSPKDATFTGNVVVHILPEAGSDIKESFIYLSDINFVTEKSLLSTAGPVRLVSQDTQMLGTGLELIYNDQLERLELFRIVNLAAIHFKGPPTNLLSRATQHNNSQAQSTFTKGAQKSNGTPTTAGGTAEQRRGEYYKCVLSKNAVIDSPEHLIFAEDRISINNILWSSTSAEEPNEAETIDKDENEVKTTDKDAKASNVTVSAESEPNQPAQAVPDTIITCDNGIFIFPMNSTIIQDDFIQLMSNGASRSKKPPKDFNDNKGRTIFITDRIDYDVQTDNSVAAGPLELTFYLPDETDTENREILVPMNIIAQKEARFLSATRQVTFEGDCACTMSRAEPNDILQKYTLLAPKLTVKLASEDPNAKSRIEHLTADGGVVELRSGKTIKGELFSGAELECRRTDYDAGQELFIATGPGEIWLNNSKVPDPNQQQSRFSLRKSCYAFLRNFATLKYFINDNLIIADAEPGQTLRVDYIPVIEGSYGQRIEAYAAHTEVGFVQTADGRSELSTLTATGGITYQEENGNEFHGSKLFYDAERSVLRIEGDESEPCYFNGTLVEKIIYDPKTGKVKAPLAGPGVLQIK